MLNKWEGAGDDEHRDGEPLRIGAVVVGVVLDVLGAAVRQHHAVLALDIAAVAGLLLGELGAVVRVAHGVVVGVPATQHHGSAAAKLL